MSRAPIALALALAAGVGGGCAGVSWHWPTLPWIGRGSETTAESAPAPGQRARIERFTDPAVTVERGFDLARGGKPLAARDLYERVVRDYPDDPARAGALFGLGLLYADPTGPLRDYRGSYATFGRLLAEHPRSRWDADARLWRATLQELLAREEETARLRSQLQRLKRIEVELDRAR
jgi:tetratricopeptide (TPR) repeat protein